jgi:glycosyltransferase involved in cell wall biosynthesis
VVLSLLQAFPGATVYTTLYDADETYPEFRDARIVTSPLDHVPFLRGHHHAALPVLASAASRLRVDADVTIASSSGWAHGFDIRGRTIVYCHNPARWLYQSEDYLGRGHGLRTQAGRLAIRTLGPSLRRWDAAAAARADSYFANSRVVQQRIHHAYGIEAEVLPPPHGVDPGGLRAPVPELADWAAHGYHLVVSRLLPYKNVDVVIEAFRDLPERLVVVGRGPEEHRLRASLGPRMRLVSGLSDPQMSWVYAHATALLAPSLEDFGLTPLEAAAFGKPTVALRAGGYLDTIVEGRTGVFFDECAPAAIRAGLVAAEQVSWSTEVLRAHADRFTIGPFAARLQAEADAVLATSAPRR